MLKQIYGLLFATDSFEKPFQKKVKLFFYISNTTNIHPHFFFNPENSQERFSKKKYTKFIFCGK